MKVLFLQETAYYESIGVMYLSAFLKQNNYEAELMIYSSEKDIYQKIGNYNPSLIAFSCTTDMHNWVISAAGECKKRFDIPIIVGGPHPTCYPEIIENSEIDIICQGEGEYSLVELVRGLEKGKDCFHIPGIWIKNHNKIHKNPPRYLIQDFSDFPLPDWDIYYRYSFLRDMPAKRFLTGRGCPYSCAFCHNQLLKEVFKGRGHYIRNMPIHKVLKEILAAKDRYPLTSVHFSDDTFLINKQWVFSFLKAYKEKVGIPFSCNVRVDLLNAEMVLALKNAGCRAVSFGLESGSEKIRNQIMNKHLKDRTIEKSVELLRKHHIQFLTTNMFGVPGEREKDIWQTLEFNRKLNPDYTRGFIFDAFPGLPLTEYAIETGHLKKDYSLSDFKALSHEPIIKNVNNNIIKNMRHLFYLLVKLPVPIRFLKILLKVPFNKTVHVVGIISQAYVEARFFNAQLFSGLRYFLHVYAGFKSN